MFFAQWWVLDLTLEPLFGRPLELTNFINCRCDPYHLVKVHRAVWQAGDGNHAVHLGLLVGAIWQGGWEMRFISVCWPSSARAQQAARRTRGLPHPNYRRFYRALSSSISWRSGNEGGFMFSRACLAIDEPSPSSTHHPA